MDTPKFKIKRKGNMLIAYDLKEKDKSYGKISLITGKFCGDTNCMIELQEKHDNYPRKEYEFMRNGTVHGNIFARTIQEARKEIFATFGRELEIYPR
jgi:hypothetical protein